MGLFPEGPAHGGESVADGLEPDSEQGDDVGDGGQLPPGVVAGCRGRAGLVAGPFPRCAPSVVAASGRPGGVCRRALRVAAKAWANMHTATWWCSAVQVLTWCWSRPIRSFPCSLHSSIDQPDCTHEHDCGELHSNNYT